MTVMWFTLTRRYSTWTESDSDVLATVGDGRISFGEPARRYCAEALKGHSEAELAALWADDRRDHGVIYGLGKYCRKP